MQLLLLYCIQSKNKISEFLNFESFYQLVCIQSTEFKIQAYRYTLLHVFSIPNCPVHQITESYSILVNILCLIIKQLINLTVYCLYPNHNFKL